jgi:altronate hydrolase
MLLADVAVHLHTQDNVAIAKVDLAEGTVLVLDGQAADKSRITLGAPVPSGHKVALQSIAVGDPVRRYGQIIGFATQMIVPGDHVHTHNIGVQAFDRDYAFGADVIPVDRVPPADRRTFMGYERPGRRAGTRNYIAVISVVNCASHTSRQIAHHFTPERLAPYPNVDGVIALTHAAGCASAKTDLVILQRTLAGMARHPNVGATLLVGLGCETNQISDLISNYDLGRHVPLRTLEIQAVGGVRKAIQAGIAEVEALLPLVNATPRTPQPLSALMLALQCGGSDGWSGVTANPLVGCVSDAVVAQGATVVLAETPEIYGAEHLLTRRAVNREVGEKLVAMVRWWETHVERLGTEIDNNPSPGNKAGGLTTIYEKALGAVAKSGHTPLMGAYDYAEPVAAEGFVFMNTPGYDPVTVTGQVAGGCNLVLFTTGRGSAFGFKPAPCIKISTNHALYRHMADDMDFNAGSVLTHATIHEVADELLDLVIAIASGQPSKSEAQGIGEEEFAPWNMGGTL